MVKRRFPLQKALEDAQNPLRRGHRAGVHGESIQQSETPRKYVLIANYLLGASNCIASSEYFAVCCLNDCETLLNHFEAIQRRDGKSEMR